MEVNPKLKREWEWFMFDDFKRVKRALWIARADRCLAMWNDTDADKYHQLANKWYWAYLKCNAMADKYKEETK